MTDQSTVYAATVKYWWATIHMPRTENEMLAFVEASCTDDFKRKMREDIDRKVQNMHVVDDKYIADWVARARS